MADHTPGDWEWGTSGYTCRRTVDAPDPDHPGCRTEVASVLGRTPEEAEANARLITASPRLLAALKRAEPFVLAELTNDPEGYGRAHEHPLYREIRDIFAEVEETPDQGANL